MIAKAKQLLEDLKILRQTHQRQVDLKNSTIFRVSETLDESNEQFQTAIQAHMRNIDTLINIQESRLNTLTTMFENDLSILESDFSTER